MIIVTSPGSNLGEDAVAAYGIHVTPQQIIVDDVAHDTREGVALETVDRWVRTARTHPHVVGTTAAEFVPILREAARREPDVAVIMTSRKVIGSHDAAVIAARKVRELPNLAHARIVVADTGVTDLGAGLACVLAAEAAAAGVGIDALPALLDAYRASVQFAFTVETLDYLVKGGRATAVRAFLANVLGVRPVVAFVDGELKVVSKMSTKAEPAQVLTESLEGSFGKGRRIWAGVFHGNAPAKAAVLTKELRRRFDVAFLCTRALSPSIYLHCGPGTLGVTAVPLDALPWKPAQPPKIA
jgi:DegV family protein with EDD domain